MDGRTSDEHPVASAVSSDERDPALGEPSRKPHGAPSRKCPWMNVNLAGFPGFIRECHYQSQLGVTVPVRTSSLFTVATVNGVDVYFYQLTGGIDGIGFSQTSDCRPWNRAQSAGSGGALAQHSLDSVQPQRAPRC